MTYSLPPLPYGFNELEPFISAEIMQLHYGKHHAGYVKNTNDALQKLSEAMKLNALDQQIVIQESITFNGGGHLNHSLFWENLAPQTKGGGTLFDGELKKRLVAIYGSVERFVEQMSAAATGVKGSGWAWLGFSKREKQLSILTTQNHDLPIAEGFAPLLCIDVWEHAYYLQYKNVRADYIKALWNIINWKTVETRLLSAVK